MQNVPIHAFRGKIIDAVYRAAELPHYVGNPLIEALPSILEPPDAADAMAFLPDYQTEDRGRSDAVRLHFIEMAQQFFEPLDCHIDLQQRFSRMIRAGYVGRNVANPGYWAWVQRQIASMDDGLEASPSELPEFTASPFRAMANGFHLIGLSGTGKTTGVERVLQTYPQLIRHRRYTEKNFTHEQIVWLRLSCPFDGSVRGLCDNFFQAIDDLCLTRYEQKYGGRRRTTVEMIPHLARVSAFHSLGVLVIDEIQNLRGTKKARRSSRLGEATGYGDGPHEMLKFFVQLINTLGLPIVLIGTYAAEGVLNGELHSMRRGCGQGAMEWKRMDADGTWWHFLESLWRYQYTRKSTALSQELANALYFETQGIADFAIKLYLLSQMRAISIGAEEVTVELIHSVGQDALAPASRVLSGLRDRNGLILRDLPDARPLDISRFIAETQTKIIAGAMSDRRRSKPADTTMVTTTVAASAPPVLPPASAQVKKRQRRAKEEFSLDGFERSANEFLG